MEVDLFYSALASVLVALLAILSFRNDLLFPDLALLFLSFVFTVFYRLITTRYFPLKVYKS